MGANLKKGGSQSYAKCTPKTIGGDIHRIKAPVYLVALGTSRFIARGMVQHQTHGRLLRAIDCRVDSAAGLARKIMFSGRSITPWAYLSTCVGTLRRPMIVFPSSSSLASVQGR